MATLLHLGLSGVRGFGTEEEQYVSFDKPLTLILGRNGCGKTTIIEALKYACTGTLPAGQGVNFVRDPKLDRKPETQAQVKLKFVCCRGKVNHISRSIQCTQKVKTLTTKTLDSTITLEKDESPPFSTSGRHTDIDGLMIKLLGVSKPILNYVIFCHQEDSFWPLDEGKKLKDRFDEIFDSTKYNKCMNEIRIIRKQTLTDIKVTKESLQHLSSDVALVKLKRSELENVETRFKETSEMMEVFKKDKSQCKKETDMWHQKYHDYRSIEKERDAVYNELEKFKNEKETLRRLITIEFHGTEEELQTAIKEFDNQLQVKEKALHKLETKKEELNALEADNQWHISETQNQLGKLEADKAHEQNAKQERNSKLSTLAQAVGLPSLRKGANEAEVDDLLVKAKKELSSLASSISALKLEQEKERNTLLEDIRKCCETKTKLEAELSMKYEMISSNDREIKKQNDKLSEIELHVGRKQKIDEDLAKCRHDHERAVQAEDPQALSNEIKNLQTVCQELEDRQSALQAEVAQLFKNQSAQKDLQRSEQKYNELQSDIKKLRSENYDFISTHLKNSSNDSIKHDFSDMVQSLRKELDRLKTHISEKNQVVSSLEQNKRHKKDQLLRKREELSRNLESIKVEIRGSRSLDEALKAVETDIERVQTDKGVLESAQIVHTRYIQQLKERDPCCPLCHRDFDNGSDATDLIDELGKKISNFPESTEECKNKLKNLKSKQHKLLQLIPLQNLNEKLEFEIPELDEEMANVDEILENTHVEIAALEKQLQAPQEQLKSAEQIQNDIFELDRSHKETKQLQRYIEKLKLENPHRLSRSADEALAEQQVIQDELSASRNEKNDAEERQRVYTMRVNSLDQKINKLVADQLKIIKLVQEKETTNERLSELTSLNAVLSTDLECLKGSLIPAVENKGKAEKVLENTKEQHSRNLDAKERERREREKEMNGVMQLQKSVINFKTQNISQALLEHKSKLDKLAETTSELKMKREKYIKESETLHNAIDGHTRRKKELDENLNLMQVSKKILKQNEKLEQVELKLGRVDLQDIRDKCLNLDQQLAVIDKQISEHQGISQELEKNICSRKKELNDSKFRFAEKKYKEKLIHHEVQSHVEKDLQKYYNALDKAMQNFHETRMLHINEYVRELWRIIYKGNDIDYIEIKTAVTSVSGATNDTDKKQNYNYRVVQVKNGTEIDMRGRCSAGQKVLACLIIRMALAETFSANCGILTLDEPTTNLDKSNIQSLCQAISDIASDHGARKSFQLVVITHDTEFLNTMSCHDFFHHYWEVKRNKQSKSEIKKRNVQAI